MQPQGVMAFESMQPQGVMAFEFKQPQGVKALEFKEAQGAKSFEIKQEKLLSYHTPAIGSAHYVKLWIAHGAKAALNVQRCVLNFRGKIFTRNHLIDFRNVSHGNTPKRKPIS